MKTIKRIFRKTILVSLLLLAGSFIMVAKGNTEPGLAEVKVKASVEPNMVNVYVSQMESSKVQIRLADMKGEIIWQAISSKDDFAKGFYLGNLPDGHYLFTFSEENAETIQPIEVIDEQVRVDPANKVVYTNPKWNTYGTFSNMRVNVIVPGEVTIKVQDNLGNSFYETTFVGESGKEQNFDVYFLDKGEYTLKVKTPYKTFSRKVTIE